jgi:hypothetical protein
VKCELRTAREQIGTLAAQMSLLTKICDELVKIVLEDLEVTDDQQDELLDALWNHVRTAHGSQFNSIQYFFIAILNTSKKMEFFFGRNSII